MPSASLHCAEEQAGGPFELMLSCHSRLAAARKPSRKFGGSTPHFDWIFLSFASFAPSKIVCHPERTLAYTARAQLVARNTHPSEGLL